MAMAKSNPQDSSTPKATPPGAASDAAAPPPSAAPQAVPDVSPADVEAALAAAGATDAGAAGGTAIADVAPEPQVEAASVAQETPAEPSAWSSHASADDAQPLPDGAMALDLPDLGRPIEAAVGEQGVGLLGDVELNVKVELGRAEMTIGDVLRLGEGSVVELDKLAGDPVDVLVNERLVARGEVLILNDNFCVRISEIVAAPEEEAVA